MLAPYNRPYRSAYFRACSSRTAFVKNVGRAYPPSRPSTEEAEDAAFRQFVGECMLSATETQQKWRIFDAIVPVVRDVLESPSCGVQLVGSIAKGTAIQGSDLDIYVDNCAPFPTLSKHREGSMLEKLEACLLHLEPAGAVRAVVAEPAARGLHIDIFMKTGQVHKVDLVFKSSHRFSATIHSHDPDPLCDRIAIAAYKVLKTSPAGLHLPHLPSRVFDGLVRMTRQSAGGQDKLLSSRQLFMDSLMRVTEYEEAGRLETDIAPFIGHKSDKLITGTDLQAWQATAESVLRHMDTYQCTAPEHIAYVFADDTPSLQRYCSRPALSARATLPVGRQPSTFPGSAKAGIPTLPPLASTSTVAPPIQSASSRAAPLSHTPPALEPVRRPAPDIAPASTLVTTVPSRSALVPPSAASRAAAAAAAPLHSLAALPMTGTPTTRPGSSLGSTLAAQVAASGWWVGGVLLVAMLQGLSTVLFRERFHRWSFSAFWSSERTSTPPGSPSPMPAATCPTAHHPPTTPNFTRPAAPVPATCASIQPTPAAAASRTLAPLAKASDPMIPAHNPPQGHIVATALAAGQRLVIPGHAAAAATSAAIAAAAAAGLAPTPSPGPPAAAPPPAGPSPRTPKAFPAASSPTAGLSPPPCPASSAAATPAAGLPPLPAPPAVSAPAAGSPPLSAPQAAATRAVDPPAPPDRSDAVSNNVVILRRGLAGTGRSLCAACGRQFKSRQGMLDHYQSKHM